MIFIQILFCKQEKEGEVTSPLQTYVASGFIPDVCFILNVREILKNKQGRSFERPYNIKHRQKVNLLSKLALRICPLVRTPTDSGIHSSNEQTPNSPTAHPA
jgi:hypothetical protein